MSNPNFLFIANEYLRTHLDVFTIPEFCKSMKAQGVKMSESDAEFLLHKSDYVFSLINKQFVTRAGVFTDRLFSFKPTKEEVEKGFFLLGHRCMPFINPEYSPDSITPINSDGIKVKSKATVFSLNLAMDVFSLFGEGYVIPFVFNDKSNDEVPLASVKYSMPQEIKLTSWPLSAFCKNHYKFKYGDRILCRVQNWSEGIVEMFVQKSEETKMQVSEAAIEREEWYSNFEDGLLKSFDRNGPSESIEEQLALLFLENQESLCIENCGSAEEFLQHTSKIGFSNYGVESRIWHKGKDVPYVGKWNEDFSKDILISTISEYFDPAVITAYMENSIYESKKGLKTDSIEELAKKIFPAMHKMSASEVDMILLNLKNQHAILCQEYNQFLDYNIAELRKRVLELFTQVNSIMSSITMSGLEIKDFPQQELIVLTQLYAHLVRLIDEVENILIRDQFPIDDVNLSLDGMEDTYEGISGVLFNSLEMNIKKSFEIVKN